MIVRQRFPDDGSFSGQSIQPEIGRVVAAPHLDYRQHLREPAVELDVPLDEDVVRDERNTLVRKTRSGTRVDDFVGHEDRHSGRRERADETI